MNIFENKTRYLLLIWLLSGCAVGPDYVRPLAPVPMAYKETSKDWKVAQPNDLADRQEWWKIFNDPTLNALEDQLNIANQTIINAIANYTQACALVDEARASFFPIVSASAAATRQGQAATAGAAAGAISSGTVSTGATASGSATASSNRIKNIHTLNLNASWEPDIWGLVRRTVEASVAGAQASGSLLAATRLSSQATLAQTYFELRSLDTDQQLLDNTTKAYEKALQLTQNRYAVGVAAKGDVVQAKTQLETAQAQSVNNKIGRAHFEHAIAVLIGELPENFSLPPNPLVTPPPTIPLEIPSALLERRPDISQAERLMAQANAEIGVAVAAYFPTLTLSGTGTISGLGFSDWFSLKGLSWAVGPQLAETIFDGGLRAATVAAARSGYLATIASYRQVVLSAFQEVEDNLASLRLLKQERIIQDQAAANAKLAVVFITNQYKAGTASYTDVITAQTTAYDAQKKAADLVGEEVVAAAGLIKSLGGGWHVPVSEVVQIKLCSGVLLVKERYCQVELS